MLENKYAYMAKLDIFIKGKTSNSYLGIQIIEGKTLGNLKYNEWNVNKPSKRLLIEFAYRKAWGEILCRPNLSEMFGLQQQRNYIFDCDDFNIILFREEYWCEKMASYSILVLQKACFERELLFSLMIHCEGKYSGIQFEVLEL